MIITPSKTHKNQTLPIKAKEFTITGFISADGEIRFHIETDLDRLVDWYEYHDAPRSVDQWLDREELTTLIDGLQSMLEYMDKLENEEKYE